MQFYVQPLAVHAESVLLELMFQRGLDDTHHCVTCVGGDDVNDAYLVTAEALFAFVKCSYGQVCNVYVKNVDGTFRSFPAYQLAQCLSLPPPDVLAVMRCRSVFEHDLV